MLNPPQAEAVRTLRGPLLVLAGAGTGKTRVVTYRIAELIRSGIAPNRILAVTFTNKAAAEMQQRAAALLKSKLDDRPEISTFHSLCVRILRRHIQLLGYPEKFAIYDRGDQEGAARSALRQIKCPNESLRPGDLLAMISRWKSASISPSQAVTIAGTDKEHLAASAYRRYQKDLKLAGAVDFDDLLLLTEELFSKFADARRAEARRFDHLLVDEYQDTNGSQYRIVKALAAGHRNLCVVGDDDQSIYGWRGAEVTHILNFKRDWPEAKVVRLEDNYRSTSAIIELANRLIVHNKTRHDKKLIAARAGGDPPRIWQFKDEEEEAKQVVADIVRRLQEPDAQPRDFAVLFRTNEQPRAFEMEMRRNNLPYVLIGGMSFYDRKEVRDVLAYLKVIAHPHDEVSLRRIVNKPPRGIGESTVALLTQDAVSQAKPLWEIFARREPRDDVSAAAAKGIETLRTLIETCHQRAEKEPLTPLLQDILQQIGYRDELVRLYPNENDFESRWASIEEIVNSLARYEKRAKKPTLAGFLEETALAEREDEDDKESQLARNAIVLLTLHSAKGLEYPQVYLVGMEENIIPHRRAIATGDEAIDEERRLCYVGVTRAQDRLTMSLALTRLKWGRTYETQPSRYLFEMTGKSAEPEQSSSRVPRPHGGTARANEGSKSSGATKRTAKGPVKRPAKRPGKRPGKRP